MNEPEIGVQQEFVNFKVCHFRGFKRCGAKEDKQLMWGFIAHSATCAPSCTGFQCCVANYPKLINLRQLIFIMSPFLCVRSLAVPCSSL